MREYRSTRAASSGDGLVQSTGSICEHGRIRKQCKECGGASVCKHGRQRPHCKGCGGASICEHGRRRSVYKECDGTQHASTAADEVRALASAEGRRYERTSDRHNWSRECARRSRASSVRGALWHVLCRCVMGSVSYKFGIKSSFRAPCGRARMQHSARSRRRNCCKKGGAELGSIPLPVLLAMTLQHEDFTPGKRVFNDLVKQ